MQSFCARRVLLCAGVGNEALLRAIQVKPSIAQRRPLHMVVVRDAPFELYGHCLQLSDKPFLTVTTDRTDDGLVWIVGGELAEQGVERTCYEQTAAAKVALAKALPWIELEQCEFDTFRVDRAEGRTRDGKRPDEPVVAEFGQVIAAWPTKLVLAPLLVDRIVEIFERDGVQPAETDLSNETCETDLGNKPWHRGDKL